MSAEPDEHQIGFKVLSTGTPVEASDGTRVGTVAKVLDNAREHIFDGIEQRAQRRAQRIRRRFTR